MRDTDGFRMYTRLRYFIELLLALGLGYLLTLALPLVFPELKGLASQGWVVTAIGGMFIFGLVNLYRHRGWGSLDNRPIVKGSRNQYSYKKAYEASIEIIPMLGFFGTVIGLLRFLPTWVNNNPDVDGVTYAFLTTAAGLILSATLRLLDSLMEEKV